MVCISNQAARRPFLAAGARAAQRPHRPPCDLGANGRYTVREQLSALRDPMDRFRLVEETLLERLRDPISYHGAVRLGLAILMRTYGCAKIRDIAKAADLSRRRFIELFAADVGVTPKLFGRLQRFQHAVATAQSRSSVDWAQLAIECGYSDQSHLIHEFVEFSGVSPFDFWRRQNRLACAGAHVKRNHLPLAG